MSVQLLVTTHDLQPVGLLPGWSNLDVTIKRNTAGSGTVSVPARPEVLALLAAGRRVEVIRRTALGLPARVFAAGPIEGEPGEIEWTAEPGQSTSGPGRITVAFTTDDCHVVERVTYPVPSQPSTLQTASATWSQTGAAGAVMHALVNANAGPGALANRRAPGLVMGAGAALGSTITLRTRFKPLAAELRTACVAGGGLSWRVRRSGTQLLFDVLARVDRTGTVRFSRGFGSLRQFRYTPESPTCTAAIVAGQGEGTARNVRERTSTAAEARWHRRVEVFVDQRQAESAAELDQAGDEQLADGAERVALSTVTRDTPRCRFGEQFGLGDLVAVELAPGLVVPDVVEAAQLTAKATEGERVTCTVGNGPASSDLDWLIEMRQVRRRLNILEGI